MSKVPMQINFQGSRRLLKQSKDKIHLRNANSEHEFLEQNKSSSLLPFLKHSNFLTSVSFHLRKLTEKSETNKSSMTSLACSTKNFFFSRLIKNDAHKQNKKKFHLQLLLPLIFFLLNSFHINHFRI